MTNCLVIRLKQVQYYAYRSGAPMYEVIANLILPTYVDVSCLIVVLSQQRDMCIAVKSVYIPDYLQTRQALCGSVALCWYVEWFLRGSVKSSLASETHFLWMMRAGGLSVWVWEAIHSWGRSSVLPQSPNHRPPIAREERYSTWLALNHCCCVEVIHLSSHSNGVLSSLTYSANACGHKQDALKAVFRSYLF